MILENDAPVNGVAPIVRCVPSAMRQDAHDTPDSGGDPFAMLGLPRRFDLDGQRIESAFLARIALAHPDLDHTDADDHPEQGRDATADTAALTEARAVLADPERRARALVRLLDPHAPADRTLPDGFLMEMMELRQQIEDELNADAQAPSASDPARDKPAPARDKWEAFAQARRRGHIARFAALAEQLAGPGAPPAQALTDARAELNAWRYTERLIEQLDPGDTLAPGSGRRPAE